MKLVIKAKDIVHRLGISREAFYKNNRKSDIFKKLSRGTYEVDEEQFILMQKYYGLKTGFTIWKCHTDRVSPKE